MICWTVWLPSQRWTISRLGPLRRRARSGIRRTCWLLFWPRRTPAARRGRESGFGVVLIGFCTKQIVLAVETLRTWGAAVLRPYMILQARQNRDARISVYLSP